jgi:TetR/AcrR family transcriptional repressor of mexJK operon
MDRRAVSSHGQAIKKRHGTADGSAVQDPANRRLGAPSLKPAKPSPKPSAKRDAIEKAAARVFLRDGYAGASMEVIAREADVSKATLYSHFQNKEDLFGAIARERCRQMAVDFAASEAAGLGPDAVLRAIGVRFLKNMLTKDMLALYRILAAEAGRFPALGRAIYASGPGPSCIELTDYLAEQTAKGRLAIADTLVAADQFYGALLGGIHFRHVLGVEKFATAQEIEARVDTAVKGFLAAYRPR